MQSDEECEVCMAQRPTPMQHSHDYPENSM